MPLVSSPIDGSPMRQISRYGIEIDVCPTTGGIWLDKGELEKLMALLREEAASDNAAYPPQHQAPRYTGHDSGHSRRHHDDDYYRHGRKKDKMSRIMDIFDF